MRMVKFHHRAAAAVAPATTLADLMGTTTYVIHGDDGEVPPFDSALLGPWGPFTAVSGPTSDQDGWLGTYRTVNFNGTSQSLLHPTTNLLTPSDAYVAALALEVPTSASTRNFWTFETDGVGHHALRVAGNVLYTRIGASSVGGASGHSLPGNTPIIIVATKSTADNEIRVKTYTPAGVGVGLKAAANTDLGMGNSAVHTIARHTSTIFTEMKLRFAALSVNQTALDETGMDALASFLQSGPYNCPLS